jgi:dTDP-4-dehydrorhamnose reductase
LRILILGPSGQIGHELAKQASELGKVITAGRTAADMIMDPLDHKALSSLFNEVKPDIVINAIAYTAVDSAESEIDIAFKLNSDLPAALADECSKINSLLIHYSTDFVFDGSQDTPWIESSATNPLSVYGRSKLAGEKAIQMASCPSLILRTSWVYGESGTNFLLTMLRLARERDVLAVVEDQVGSPSCSNDIAQATLLLCKRYIIEPEYVSANRGIYHLTASGQTSWYGFAKAIFDIAGLKESLKIKELSAISSGQYPTAAVRPPYAVLNCTALKEIFNVELTDWHQALENSLQRYYLNK